jgi:hypothetical protein
MALCVAGSATSGSVRVHSTTWPSHEPAAGADAVTAPEASARSQEDRDRAGDQHGRRERRRRHSLAADRSTI